ncbi:hypothetical protein FHPHGOJG_02561 [Mannheimia haemolytica]
MSEPNHAEQIRRLDNIIRLGTIAEVDLTTATARVNSGGITTDFLPWLTFRAGTSQTWSAPTVGEQCVVLSVSGEFTTGVIYLGFTPKTPRANPPMSIYSAFRTVQKSATTPQAVN